MDLLKEADKIEGKTIGLEFVAYSGDPHVKVAFDDKFAEELRGKDNEETVTYLITEDMRRMASFKGTLFISVASEGNADYYFHVALYEKDYIILSP